MINSSFEGLIIGVSKYVVNMLRMFTAVRIKELGQH